MLDHTEDKKSSLAQRLIQNRFLAEEFNSLSAKGFDPNGISVLRGFGGSEIVTQLFQYIFDYGVNKGLPNPGCLIYTARCKLRANCWRMPDNPLELLIITHKVKKNKSYLCFGESFRISKGIYREVLADSRNLSVVFYSASLRRNGLPIPKIDLSIFKSETDDDLAERYITIEFLGHPWIYVPSNEEVDFFGKASLHPLRDELKGKH